MTCIAGIYGFQISRPMRIGDLTFQPVSLDHQESKQLARDLDAYHLTATVTGESLDEDMHFKLEAILSFIEHLEVLITLPIKSDDGNENTTEPFAKTLRTQRRNNGGGAVIAVDTFFPQSRQKFIELVLGRLSDTNYCETKKFNSLFFKCVETFRQRKPFLEITYFLLFSGLESFARAVRSDPNIRNSSEPIFRLLESYGFRVYLEKPADLPRAISTYTHIRNALFHNGEFQTTVPMNGTAAQLKTVDYLASLSILVSLTIMKAVQFDDGHINWDAWIDRQLFK